MKSMTKLMIVAMIIAAALVIAPASAARDVNTSVNGNVIYVGEANLNFTDLDLATGYLVRFTGNLQDRNVDHSITIPNGQIVELTRSMVPNANTGGQIYHLFNSSDFQNSSVVALGTMTVRLPNVELQVRSGTNSIAGSSVTPATALTIRVENNLAIQGGLIGIPMEIWVTSPGGGRAAIGDTPLNNFPLTDQVTMRDDLRLNSSAERAGTYTVQARWPSLPQGNEFRDTANNFRTMGFNSNTVTFEVRSRPLVITADRDSIIRGNTFSVTITGEVNQDVVLSVDDVASLEGPRDYPVMVNPFQNWFTLGNQPIQGEGAWNATINLGASGSRTVQFITSIDTDDRAFTIRVTPEGGARSDSETVRVRVEQGTVTITASGTGVYYIGEEITFSGIATENDEGEIFLFITGPNIGDMNLEVTRSVTHAVPSNFTVVQVEDDDTWSHTWDTSDLGRTLDAGGYTIFVLSDHVLRRDLGTVQFDTVSIQLRTGFITATSSGAIVARGDDLIISGTAMGDPSEVQVWIFGRNFQISEGADVEDDGSFEYELSGARTQDLTSGQYFAVIQHPMMNGQLDIIPARDGSRTSPTGGDGLLWMIRNPETQAGSGVQNVLLSGLQATNAATALIEALNSPNIDDTYVRLSFVVEEANIWIDAVGDRVAGSTFTITGTTNLAVGNDLNVEVVSAAFRPTDKTEATTFGAISGVVQVREGQGTNVWSFEVDGSSFNPDQYIVIVESIRTGTTATTTFNVVEFIPTQPPVVTPTTTPTVPPTATPTPEPTSSPGFGALLALAGLGAVAFLVLRRK